MAVHIQIDGKLVPGTVMDDVREHLENKEINPFNVQHRSTIYFSPIY